MSISFTHKFTNGVLLITSEGIDEDLETAQQYQASIIELAIKYQATKVLCDERNLIYDLGTIDTFELAKFMSENVPQVAKVAIVTTPINEEEADFFETTASNRGLIIRFFYDTDEANDWLNDTTRV